jgi:SAM-dependent methyltransferase
MAHDARDRDDATVEAIFERLRAEVRSGSPREAADAAESSAADWQAAREEVERRWRVTAERSFLRRPGPLGRVRGAALTPVKASIRKLMRWYVEPLAADQRSFNAAIVRLADELNERTGRELERLSRTVSEVAERAGRVPELEDRIARLERRPPAAASRTPRDGAAAPEVDYFAFEARMRGSTVAVRAKQERYVEDFLAAAPVLDVGCGRGEFLELLRREGIAASGVDSDPDMVAFCLADGLDVVEGDALAHLEGLAEGSLGGLFAAQFVEHLPPAALVRFLELAASRLRPGGVFVAETINPVSLGALRHYFADLSHAQPLVPETLELLARQAGFASVEIRYLNEPDAATRLRPVELPSDPLFQPAQQALAANVDRLNEVVFGPQDYAVVAHR